MNDQLTETGWTGYFIPEYNLDLDKPEYDFMHDQAAWIDNQYYGLPGDFNEDSGY